MNILKALSAASGGSGVLVKFAAAGGGVDRAVPGHTSTFKKVVLVLLGMLLMGSVASMAADPPTPITATNAVTSIANAVESGLRSMAAGGGVQEIGRALFGFFIAANLIWMLLKSFVAGTGFFSGFGERAKLRLDGDLRVDRSVRMTGGEVWRLDHAR